MTNSNARLSFSALKAKRFTTYFTGNYLLPVSSKQGVSTSDTSVLITMCSQSLNTPHPPKRKGPPQSTLSISAERTTLRPRACLYVTHLCSRRCPRYTPQNADPGGLSPKSSGKYWLCAPILPSPGPALPPTPPPPV